MKIVVRTGTTNFSMPVPIAMADVAIKAMPDVVFEKIGKRIGAPYDRIISKKAVSMLFKECRDIFKENKGLEIVHVEAADGTYISIKL